MQNYTQYNNADTLSLAFHTSATRKTRVFHPWRYFVAEGETLAKIGELLTIAGNAPKLAETLAEKAGAISFDGFGFKFDHAPSELAALTGKERVDPKFEGRSREPWQGKRVERIPGFVLDEGHGYPVFLPDVATEKGREFRNAAKTLAESANPAKAFAQWLGAYEVFVPNDLAETAEGARLSATVTRVGKEWIVAVPVSVSGGLSGTVAETWAVPPQSKAITVAEYFTKVEQANLLKNMPKASA